MAPLTLLLKLTLWTLFWVQATLVVGGPLVWLALAVSSVAPP